ncbi:MAG: peptidoglycan bridge formation glycyltransferase FemA/FemB family protein [Candidatus Levybacteria bacterium]|nr:peptidoglycan bridge formation glycyltransferase FemA/FemB family protein [Candidatus Levybacteria bacterium]
MVRDITEKEKKDFNKIVTHPLQSYEWGEFREKTGIKVLRRGFFEREKLVDGFQLTIHKIPKTPWNIGYLPKGNLPSYEIIKEVKKIGKEENCVFIQLEPNIEVESLKNNSQLSTLNSQLKPAAHPLFTKYTFVLDLTKSEEELLKNMHPKTRYNIKVAQKHGVEIIEDNSNQAFKTYFFLVQETTKRQKFYAHTENYHRLMWETLRQAQSKPLKVENGKLKVENYDKNKLSAHLFLAKYQPNSQLSTLNSQLSLVAWILFTFRDTIYYPYGASSSLYREAMASNLMMWEAIKFGKKLGFKKFDMWGSLNPNPDPKDPWYGFHRFKEGYGGKLTEFIGSYDLVIRPNLYRFYKTADKIRWSILKLRK